MRISKTIWASAVISLLCTAAFAQQILTGTIASVDEQKGTITIQRTPSGTVGGGAATEQFKAQDGLLFNALRPGDKVSFTVVEANGTKTITKLDKQ